MAETLRPLDSPLVLILGGASRADRDLRDEGLQVIACCHAVDGVNAVSFHRPNVVVVDVYGEGGGGGPLFRGRAGRPTGGGGRTLSGVCTGGRLVLLGFAAKPTSVQGGRVTFRELEIIGTLGCRNIDFPSSSTSCGAASSRSRRSSHIAIGSKR